MLAGLVMNFSSILGAECSKSDTGRVRLYPEFFRMERGDA